MSEEIIINGVDVSDCKNHKSNGKCRIPHYQQNIKYVSCNCNEWDCDYKQLKRLEQENEQIYEEKTCLHKIIDRLLENAGYSKDIASAEDFESVYESMQYNKQKLSELQQTLQEIKDIAEKNIFLKPEILTLKGDIGYIQNEVAVAILQILTKAESKEE